MSEKLHLLVDLAVITLGVPELRDAEGHITRESTLRNVRPGETFEITNADDAQALKDAGHARDLTAEEAEAQAEAAKPAAKPRAKRTAAAPEQGAAEQGATTGDDTGATADAAAAADSTGTAAQA